LTVFGKTVGPEEISALAGVLVLLALWLVVLRNERLNLAAFRKWEADRKARRDAEIARENGEDAPPPGPKRGPWG
jgi:hypothetical protein